MGKNIPRGYDWRDGELQVNDAEATIVKWIYKMVIEYYDNPPDILIKDAIDKYEDGKLSYEEAKEHVTFTMVKRYLVAELNQRLEQYEENIQGDVSSELEEFLKKPMDKELLTIVEEEYKFSHGVGYDVELFNPKRVNKYFGKIEKVLSEQDFKTYGVEPLIPMELYEKAVEKIEKYKDETLNKEQYNDAMMRLE
ncbi:hypothetical protein KQI38_21090 [Tissierella carlieri]|uniref:hypothetical protein n=1 Tax=Tissierella carlieri TaxID=689904 RepID=UPI001C0F3CAB|nr:hypothetical protein [Tissierella carlieri]MBU5314522.1 hypothetical protein [Tissierella carlieri]